MYTLEHNQPVLFCLVPSLSESVDLCGKGLYMETAWLCRSCGFPLCFDCLYEDRLTN